MAGLVSHTLRYGGLAAKTVVHLSVLGLQVRVSLKWQGRGRALQDEDVGSISIL